MAENYFDTVAKEWNTPERMKNTTSLAEDLLIKIGVESAPLVKALEIGSGSGMLAVLLSKLFKKIDCIDSSSGMREEFLQNKEKYSAENIFIYGEEYLDSTDEKYDLIYSHKAFHHIVDVEGELRKLKRVMAKGGRLFLIDFCTIPPEFHKDFPNFNGHHGFSKEEISDYFQNAGLKLAEYEIIRQGKSKDIDYKLFLAVGII